jgi:hypothetical protein
MPRLLTVHAVQIRWLPRPAHETKGEKQGPHLVPICGAVGARTPNLRRAKAMLSQLSYSPLNASCYPCLP